MTKTRRDRDLGAQLFDPCEGCCHILRAITAQDLKRLFEQQGLSVGRKVVVEKHEGFGRVETVGVHVFGCFMLVL